MSTWILLIMLSCGGEICSVQYLKCSDIFDCLATKQTVTTVYQSRERHARVALVERYDWNPKQLAFGHSVWRHPS